MKIKFYPVQRMSIEEFADKHNLVMEVHERDRDDISHFRYYAHFKNSETKDGIILSSDFGDGRTPEKAISHYADRISGKLLIIDAYKKSRREINVPILIEEKP